MNDQTIAALRQEGPQQDEVTSELRQMRGHLCNMANDYPVTVQSMRFCLERLEAALSASRTAQAPQQEGVDLAPIKALLTQADGAHNPDDLSFSGKDCPKCTAEKRLQGTRGIIENLLAEIERHRARIQVLDTSVDYLRNLIDHPVKQWLPIETAPKDAPLWLVEDGARLGMLCPHQVAGWWVDDKRYEAGGYWCALDSDKVIAATHWMPLPSAPAPVAPAEGEQ